MELKLDKRKDKVGMEKLLNGNYKTVVEWMSRLLLLLVSVLITYNLSQLKEVTDLVHNLDTRLSIIEANRFTSKDGLLIQQELLNRPTRIELQNMLDRMEDRLTNK